MHGIKTISIHARCAHPIVSAFEFEQLKREKGMQEILKPCTIYMIVQRPLLMMTNVRTGQGWVEFEISDGTGTPALLCRFSAVDNGYCAENEPIDIGFEFFDVQSDPTQPFGNVAGFKLWKGDGAYVGWFSPTVILYRYFSQSIEIEIDGPIDKYVDYRVHYIGQAFSQPIWNRLTGHSSFQSVLTMQQAFASACRQPAFEISLMLLSITGFEEGLVFPAPSFLSANIPDPILHPLETDTDVDHFSSVWLSANAVQLTNEIEAMLIDKFKPAYNTVLYSKYPSLRTGTRSVGYSESSLVIEHMPVLLRTDAHQQGPLPF